MPKKKEKVMVIPTICAYHDEKDENLIIQAPLPGQRTLTVPRIQDKKNLLISSSGGSSKLQKSQSGLGSGSLSTQSSFSKILCGPDSSSVTVRPVAGRTPSHIRVKEATEAVILGRRKLSTFTLPINRQDSETLGLRSKAFQIDSIDFQTYPCSHIHTSISRIICGGL